MSIRSWKGLYDMEPRKKLFESAGNSPPAVHPANTRLKKTDSIGDSSEEQWLNR